jgi:hypothetical protein
MPDERKKNKDKPARRKYARAERKHEPIEVVVTFSRPDPGEKPDKAANPAGETSSAAKNDSQRPIVFRF